MSIVGLREAGHGSVGATAPPSAVEQNGGMEASDRSREVDALGSAANPKKAPEDIIQDGSSGTTASQTDMKLLLARKESCIDPAPQVNLSPRSVPHVKAGRSIVKAVGTPPASHEPVEWRLLLGLRRHMTELQSGLVVEQGLRAHREKGQRQWLAEVRRTRKGGRVENPAAWTGVGSPLQLETSTCRSVVEAYVDGPQRFPEERGTGYRIGGR